MDKDWLPRCTEEQEIPSFTCSPSPHCNSWYVSQSSDTKIIIFPVTEYGGIIIAISKPSAPPAWDMGFMQIPLAFYMRLSTQTDFLNRSRWETRGSIGYTEDSNTRWRFQIQCSTALSSAVICHIPDVHVNIDKFQNPGEAEPQVLACEMKGKSHID